MVVLNAAICAVAASNRSYTAIAEWFADVPAAAALAVGIAPDRRRRHLPHRPWTRLLRDPQLRDPDDLHRDRLAERLLEEAHRIGRRVEKPAPASGGSSISAMTAQNRLTLIDKVAWIYLKDRRVLSTRSVGKDVYYLPGGKRETGESDLETLIREIQEELTVRIDASTVVHYGTFEAQAHGHSVGVTVRMTCFVAGYTGELAAANEIAEIAWLTMRDRERVSPVDKMIFAHLHEAHLLRD